jgi:hypothetical protein
MSEESTGILNLAARLERTPSMKLRLGVEDNELEDVHVVSE